MEQGLQISCVDCTILYGSNPECPRCGGSGRHFQAAQMCDESIQWERGRHDRRACDEFRDAQAWPELARAIRGCFVSSLIWGAGWAAGYLGVRFEEPGEVWERWEVILDEWKALEPALKAEYFEAKTRGEGDGGGQT